jgi:hypothetical protein
LLVANPSGSSGGNDLSGEDIGATFVDFINARGGPQIEYVSYKEDGNLYELTVLAEGQEVPAHVTRDGKYFVQVVFPLDEEIPAANPDDQAAQQTPTDIPKLDKPVVDLFVMSLCPYGTQALKGILPVAEALGDKIDFNVKFVSYAMHGKEEMDENTRQYCIQKEQPEKLYEYLRCYLKESGISNWDACANEVGIDEDKINNCIESTDTEFKITELFNDESTWSNGRFPQYNVDKEDSELYGVRGSPTFVINGVMLSNQGRNPASYLTTICSSFSGDAPAECSQTFDSASPSPGFGWEGNAAGGADASCE